MIRDDTQMVLPFPMEGQHHYEVGDLVLFPSGSHKWNHLREVMVVHEDSSELTTKDPGGAIQVGTPMMQVRMFDVLAHWRRVPNDT